MSDFCQGVKLLCGEVTMYVLFVRMGSWKGGSSTSLNQALDTKCLDGLIGFQSFDPWQ